MKIENYIYIYICYKVLNNRVIILYSVYIMLTYLSNTNGYKNKR